MLRNKVRGEPIPSIFAMLLNKEILGGVGPNCDGNWVILALS
jgi:hypothetical protein